MATDDVKVLRMLWLFLGLTYYSATYFYANELENSSQPKMKHPKLEKGKRSQGFVFIQNKLLAIAFSLNKLVFLVVLLCIGLQMWILQFQSHVDTVINDVGGALRFNGFYGQPNSLKHKES